MTIYYSAAARGFFHSDIHAHIPGDAVKISPARHRKLLEAQAEGAAIEPDAKGRPRSIAPRKPDRRAQLAGDIKREAQRRIEAVSPIWRQINDQREPSAAGNARFAAVDAIRAASTLVEADLAACSDSDLTTFDPITSTHWTTS